LITRLKLLKRQGDGRASVELLRFRLLAGAQQVSYTLLRRQTDPLR